MIPNIELHEYRRRFVDKLDASISFTIRQDGQHDDNDERT